MRPYRRRMNSFPESTFDAPDSGPGFLGLLGIALLIVTAGVSIAVLIAGV
jgi:hypothetical protein